MTRIEALVDAIASIHGWHDPRSEAYQLRNPLLLKAFSPKHEKNENGIRIFRNTASGYDNACLDASIKCSGRSHSKLTPDSTLRELVGVYGNSIVAARAVKNFLRAALKNDEIYETQKLGWFLESEPQAQEVKE
jgi:hypothetical protein